MAIRSPPELRAEYGESFAASTDALAVVRAGLGAAIMSSHAAHTGPDLMMADLIGLKSGLDDARALA